MRGVITSIKFSSKYLVLALAHWFVVLYMFYILQVSQIDLRHEIYMVTFGELVSRLSKNNMT
jgi:hypothetical protein